MHFDWYQATVNAPHPDIFSAMEKAYPHSDLRPAKPSNGYTYGAELVLGDLPLVRTMWGGVNGDDTTHCVATGRNSEPFAGFIRRDFPDHQVSRADVAIDYHEEGSFKKLAGLLIGYSKGKRLKTATAGDWIKNEGGRTLYLGSRSSTAYLRLYEKGKQLVETEHPHWTRCELEVKPSSKEGKALLSRMSPMELWGTAGWARDVAALLGKSGIPRAQVGTLYTPSDDDRALHFMLKQYGPLIKRIYELVGEDWSLVGPFLARRLCPEEFGLVDAEGIANQLELF